MIPAVCWFENDERSGWHKSVERRMRERARVSEKQPQNADGDAAVSYEEALIHAQQPSDGPRPNFSVAVFVMCQPDSAPAHELRRRRPYFDVRTGDDWDVFFPGYFQGRTMDDPNEILLDGGWGFSPRAFNDFRRVLESKTARRWTYSGGSDLILLDMVTMPDGFVTGDYASVLSGPMTDSWTGTSTLTLGEVIEAISQDLETDAQDSAYGVSEVVGRGELARRDVRTRKPALRELAVGTAAGILSQIGAQALGLGM